VRWFHVHHALGSLNGISIRQEKGFISLDIDSRDFGPDRPSVFGARSKEELNVARLLTIGSAPGTDRDGNLTVLAITHAGPEDPHNNHDLRYVKMPVGALDQPVISRLQSCNTS
jgi:hypothetical protein